MILNFYLLIAVLSWISVTAFYQRRDPHDTANNVWCAFVVAATWPVLFIATILTCVLRKNTP